jgi:purine-binding chemotaxis protein CheW
LRGKVIPVIDLRLKFGMDEVDETDKTCVIVVQISGRDGETVIMGTIVDEVSEVLDITAAEIEPSPSMGSSVDTQFILGMAKAKGSVKILLDINKVLSSQDIAAMASL